MLTSAVRYANGPKWCEIQLVRALATSGRARLSQPGATSVVPETERMSSLGHQSTSAAGAAYGQPVQPPVMAAVHFTPVWVAPVRLAPLRLAPLRSAWLMSAPRRSAPRRSAPFRL